MTKFKEANGEAGIQLPGIKMLDTSDATTLRIEVDVDTMPISNFISELSNKYPFTDISIKELPMEKS